ncbi:MAG: hypothetical protein ACI9BW_002420 [Gammaproteobacteria bacterium]|jgi:hypothetical protein
MSPFVNGAPRHVTEGCDHLLRIDGDLKFPALFEALIVAN